MQKSNEIDKKILRNCPLSNARWGLNPYGQPDRKKKVFFTTFLRDVVQKQIFYGQAERVGLILLGLVYSVNLFIFAKT